MHTKLVAHPGRMPRSIGLLLDWLDSECFPGDDLEIKDDSYWWMTFDEGHAVAFAGLQYTPFNLPGYQGKVGYLCRSGVLNTHRGRGLQRLLIQRRVNHAWANDMSRVVSYTHVENVHSSNNLIRTNFKLYTPKYYSAGKEFLYWHRIKKG